MTTGIKNRKDLKRNTPILFKKIAKGQSVAGQSFQHPQEDLLYPQPFATLAAWGQSEICLC